MSQSITVRALRARADAQVPPRLGLRAVAVFIALQLLLFAALLLVFPSAAGAAPVKGEVAVTASNGYVRLVFNLADETEADVRLANGIVIIGFKSAIEVPVDHIATNSGGYVGAARRDPDGSAIRLALTRKVTVNSMAAGEKFFVDLLPEGWAGLPPGLPQEVIDDLARRAREADKKVRQQQRIAALRAQPPVRVRVGAQPTFTRYIFELPGLVPVSIDRAENRLTLTFDAPLRFDLGDVQGALPPTIGAIEAEPAAEKPAVRFAFLGKVDVRTFREDNNYVVDIQPIAQRETVADRPNKPSGLASALIETRPAATAPSAAPVAPPVSQRRVRRQPRRPPFRHRRPRRRRRQRPIRFPHSPPRPRRASSLSERPRRSRPSLRRRPSRRPRSRSRSSATATRCVSRFRSPHRRRPRCSGAPIRSGWYSTVPFRSILRRSPPSRAARSAMPR
jgi:hypothetical protein